MDELYTRSEVRDMFNELLMDIDLCFDDGELVDKEQFENVLDDARQRWAR